MTSGGPSGTATSRSTTSRRSGSGTGASSGWRHWSAGSTPSAAWCPRRLHPGRRADRAHPPLTDAVLDRALQDCAAWRQQGLDLTVAVNLCARSLLDPTLPERVADSLRTHALPSSCLELEITESAAMKDPGRALEVLHRLRGLGVHLSVDDYGTGHASLAYLTRLPVGTLKIDRSFVQAMELDSSDGVIVRSTIELAHSLGLRVVAEGVETRASWAELAALGCDEAQGYWLARPGPAGTVPAAVAEIERRLASSSIREPETRSVSAPVPGTH
ncbi:EAL domain-containing protein [Blastococcus brunescens]|uniref:EAL domain-containing protein n=1 Tax=Blastococcus brunescens TaxID=1564165 RepID=A0ABZ1B257_9ACTN|nr:EAL domain-containing protein [Blastococcus sp. BMG 8361]WRL64902.1 EAL domain-containing protein [Blastococcus sp. BMG 8361]